MSVEQLAKAFADKLKVDMSADDFAAMLERNASLPQGICASHDFRDSNMDMESAYVETFGDPWDSNGHLKAEVYERWNQAWDIAKRDYLTAKESKVDIYANLPPHIAEQMKALKAKRETQGCNVYFINERGEHDCFSMRDPDRAERFRESLLRRRLTVFADKAESEAHKAANNV